MVRCRSLVMCYLRVKESQCLDRESRYVYKCDRISIFTIPFSGDDGAAQNNLPNFDFLHPSSCEDKPRSLAYSGSMPSFQHSSTRLLLRKVNGRTQQPFSKTTQRRKTSAGAKKPVDDTASLKPENQEANDASSSAVPTGVDRLPLLQRLGPLTRVAQAYDRIQKRRPWTTQLCASLFVYCCGDQLAQFIDGERYDPVRTLRHLTIGAGASIPGYTW